MTDYVELRLRPDNQDPDLKNIDRLCLPTTQIGPFFPINDETGGCKLNLNNGGVLRVLETYEELRWFTRARTIEEHNKLWIEAAEENGFGDDSKLSAKYLREATGLYRHPKDYQKIAGIISDEITEHEAVSPEAVKEDIEDIVNFAKNQLSRDDFGLPAEISDERVERLRERLLEEVEKPQGAQQETHQVNKSIGAAPLPSWA